MAYVKKEGISIGKYASIAAAGITAVYGVFATVDYAGRWFNQAATAIQELGTVKTAIARHELEQKEDFKEVKQELAELRQDMTRLLMISRQPDERVKIAGIVPEQ